MKRFLKYTFITAFLICLTSVVTAQPPGSKRDKIEALRVAFITKRVHFTAQEAQAFWPLYNEMNDKQDAARKIFRRQYNARTNFDFGTEAEAQAYLNAELLLKQREYEIYREYYEKFKKILPLKKVAAVRRAEEDFKREIIKSIREN